MPKCVDVSAGASWFHCANQPTNQPTNKGRCTSNEPYGKRQERTQRRRRQQQLLRNAYLCVRVCMYGCLFRSFNHQLHRPKQRRDHVRQQAVVTATDADRQSNKANKGFRGERGGGDQTQLCLGIHSYSIVSYWITKTTMPRA